jgi:hypothetical protein
MDIVFIVKARGSVADRQDGPTLLGGTFRKRFVRELAARGIDPKTRLRKYIRRFDRR